MIKGRTMNREVVHYFCVCSFIFVIDGNISFAEKQPNLSSDGTATRSASSELSDASEFHYGSSERRLFRRDSKGHSWNYEEKAGPGKWPVMFNKCAGSRQSPVDIDPEEADFNEDLNDFEFDNYDDPLEGARIENNGHTVVVTPGSNDAPRTIEEGGMDDKYQFVQLHFHWGSDSKKGSEHTIDGKKYPLEMHLVHRNTNYKTMEAAIQKEDGLAVLGVLFKLDHEDNKDLEPIIDKLDEVRKEGTSADLDDIELENLLPDDLMPYYRYEGSLTTPTCNEAVIWTIFKHTLSISEKQLQQFRLLKESDDGEADEDLVNNYRPVQPLHERVIEVSGEETSAGITAATFASSKLQILATLSLLVLARFAN